MTTWYLCKQDDTYKMVQADSVGDLDWMLPFGWQGRESVVDTHTTDLDLVMTTHTVFGDQCTERCCETFLTDFEVTTGIEHYVDAKELWDCVTKGEVFYGENEDVDYRSGDTSTHHYFFGRVEGLEVEDPGDYPRRDEGDELDDEQLHESFDAFLDETNDVEVAGFTLSPSRALKECDEAAYRAAFVDWIDAQVSDDVYVERDGRYFEKV